jgi:hypothetical protein
VIHLATAALGAESFYTLENNDARGESLEEARNVDRRLESLWREHPDFHYIDNRDGLEEKLRRAETAACDAVGAYPPGPSTTTLLLARPPSENELPSSRVEFRMRQYYLLGEEPFPASMRRRERALAAGLLGPAVHTHRVPLARQGKMLALIEQPIAGREFAASRRQADPAFAPLIWRRYCFALEGSFCELYLFEAPRPGRAVLRVYHAPDACPPQPAWPIESRRPWSNEEALLRSLATEQ